MIRNVKQSLTIKKRTHNFRSIILFGFAHLLATAILLIINVIYFGYSIKKSKLPSSFTSVKSFLPSVSGGDVDRDRISLVVAFLKQGLVKQVLTESEKYMFTCFSLMTLTQQGHLDFVLISKYFNGS